MFFRFKQNKNIVNVNSVNYRFKLRRTVMKQNWETKGEPIAAPSICFYSLLLKMKDDSVVASLS